VTVAVWRRLRAEGGFTLIELLVGMTIGMIVLFALYGLLEQVAPATTRVMDRVDAQARGRAATEQMARLLRITTCVESGTDTTTGNATFWSPYAYADDTKVIFYTDSVSSTTEVGAGAFAPQKRQFQYTNGTITETTWQGDTIVPPNFPAVPTATRTLVTGVQPTPGKPVFAYKGYSGTPATLGTLTPLNDGTGTIRVSDTDLPHIARIDVAFTAVPSNGRNSAASASFEDSINTRPAVDLATDTTANRGPQCQI
jgi:prepilin-type N-terminal cleavage/methylation domain-containing protein